MNAVKRLRRCMGQLCSVALMVCAVWGGPSFAYDTPDVVVEKHLTTNIVVALVGYHVTREVAYGIRIPYFSAEKLDGDTNTCSILMYVIAPTEYAGKFLWLAGDDAFNQHETSSYFGPDKFYYIPISELRHHADSVKSNAFPSILFDLSQVDNQGTLFRLKNITTRRYFVSISELSKRLNELEIWKVDVAKRLAELSQMQGEDTSSKENRKRVSNKKMLQMEMQWIDILSEDAVRQKPLVDEQWKVLHKNVPLGIGKGYIDYINEKTKDFQ